MLSDGVNLCDYCLDSEICFEGAPLGCSVAAAQESLNKANWILKFKERKGNPFIVLKLRSRPCLCNQSDKEGCGVLAES